MVKQAIFFILIIIQQVSANFLVLHVWHTRPPFFSIELSAVTVNNIPLVFWWVLLQSQGGFYKIRGIVFFHIYWAKGEVDVEKYNPKDFVKTTKRL